MAKQIVGESPALRQALARLKRVAPTKRPVHITGETGTGKELAARLVHEASGRRGQFVAVNCAAIPGQLLESELFGHEKGAFTSAVGRRRGKFELAHKGTLFLDEVAELEPQAKLLRVLQEGVFERVGSERPITVDVRIVSATHRDLAAMVQEGTFREDLYYRLRGYPVHLPPLRERGRDVALLATSILSKEFPGVKLSPSAVEALMGHPWLGNVRELEGAVLNAAVDARGDVVGVEHLAPYVGGGQSYGPGERAFDTAPPLTDRQRAAYWFVKSTRRGTARGLAAACDFTLRTAQRVLAELVELGLVRADGRGRGVGYLDRNNAAA